MALFTNGTWGVGSFKLPDFGVTELLGVGKANPNVGYPANPNTAAVVTPRNQAGAVLGANTTRPSTTTTPYTGGTTTRSTGTPTGDPLSQAVQSQNDAANAQSDAAKVAAQNAFDSTVNAANSAKEEAKGQYDWVVNTLGSNKQDLLTKVAQNEQQGLAGYDKQRTTTTEDYSRAKQDILSVYRDLNLQQEKIMRGSGQGQSSRSQEAQLRLSNLMGKDLTSLSTNEADALAMIGNAVTTLKGKTVELNNTIEKQTTQQLDQVALQYNSQINQINNTIYNSKLDQINDIKAAEATLASQKAGILTWAAQTKLQAEQTVAQLKGNLDDFIVQMTDYNGLLNTDLATKQAATQQLISTAKTVSLDNPNVANPTQAIRQQANRLKTPEEVQAALAAGTINPTQAQAALLGTSPDPLASAIMPTTTMPTAPDPLRQVALA